MKQVYLQSFPGGEELGSAVVGTRVILSHPHSRDEDIHTDAGSNLLDRKESPATNIKRL